MNSSTLKKIGLTAGIGAASIVAAGQDTDKKDELAASPSSLEWHFTQGGADKARINLFYNLPLKTSAYSFMEFYGKGGYFGKNMLNTALLKKLGVGIKTETSHALFANSEGGDFSYNQIGIGFEKQAVLPGNVFLALKYLPAVVRQCGAGRTAETEFGESQIIGYYVSKSININKNMKINLSSFLDIDIANMASDYGESDATLEIRTKHGQIDTGIGYNHNVTGKLAPDNQFRVRVGYHPKK